MAVTSFGLNNTDVLSEVPGPAGDIDSTSSPVNTAQLTDFREDASGTIAALLSSRGIDPDALDDNSERVVFRAIRAYVAWKVLQKHEGNGAQAASYRSEWEDTKKIVASMPDQLGASHAQSATYNSNIDSSTPKTKRWVTQDSDGNGFTGW